MWTNEVQQDGQVGTTYQLGGKGCCRVRDTLKAMNWRVAEGCEEKWRGVQRLRRWEGKSWCRQSLRGRKGVRTGMGAIGATPKQCALDQKSPRHHSQTVPASSVAANRRKSRDCGRERRSRTHQWSGREKDRVQQYNRRPLVAGDLLCSCRRAGNGSRRGPCLHKAGVTCG